LVEKLKSLFLKYYDAITYLIFGVLTTLVNYAVYLPCYNWLHLSASVSNVVAWTVAVAFAFLTNKPFVFRSHDWSAGVVLPELVKFVGCRVGSGVLETAILWLTVDQLHWNGNVWKLVTSVLVVILNYVASKLLVFTRKA
jgi:putative flippase GtrA